MCKVTLTAGLFLIITSLASSSRLVCYYNSEAENRADYGKFTISDIDPNKCTHLIYAFADIDNQNELVPSSATDIQRYQPFNGLKTRNPALKTLLAVGGLTFDTQKFTAMVATTQNRETFIQSAIKLLRESGFDGLNLEWRNRGGAGSPSQDKQSFTMLCKELKEAFVSEGKAANRDSLIVAASVSAEKATIDASYQVPQIAMHLDFINVLTFDFHGPWESVTGHHSSGSFCAGNPDGYYRSPDNPSSFYQCFQGRTYLHHCPGDLIFSEICSCCDFNLPTRTTAMPTTTTLPTTTTSMPTTTTPVTKPTTTTAASGSVCAGQPDGYYRSPDNPAIYYRCFQGREFSFTCPAGLIFSETCNCCDFTLPTKTTAMPTTTTIPTTTASMPTTTTPVTKPTTTPTTTTAASGSFCVEQPDGYYTSPANPNKYYRCFQGREFSFTCPVGLIFSEICSCCNRK